jgi:type VI secretion system protein ImpA
MLSALMATPAQVARLQALITDRTGRADAIDLSRLRAIGQVLHKACAAVAGTAAPAEPAAAADAGEQPVAADSNAPAQRPAVAGELRTREDVLQTLDRVIRYLEQAEPGNPAPLLIARAKKLIGVSFLEIMADLAPNALDTIEAVTGKQTTE